MKDRGGLTDGSDFLLSLPAPPRTYLSYEPISNTTRLAVVRLVAAPLLFFPSVLVMGSELEPRLLCFLGDELALVGFEHMLLGPSPLDDDVDVDVSVFVSCEPPAALRGRVLMRGSVVTGLSRDVMFSRSRSSVKRRMTSSCRSSLSSVMSN